jgi:RimJ/RimL family protein N-acetyltransferase
MNVEPVELVGDFVRLEPLSETHLDGLCDVGLDSELWKWTLSLVDTPEKMTDYVRSAIADREKGVALPFATIEKATGKVIGSTRFGNIETANRKTEIGWTWVASEWQRTRVNTEAKLLMLAHAFETWKCIRVEFKTDALNERSRNAILRLGAKQEGIHRNHMTTETGRFRDSVFFSIIEPEWITVKEGLTNKLKG